MLDFSFLFVKLFMQLLRGITIWCKSVKSSQTSVEFIRIFVKIFVTFNFHRVQLVGKTHVSI